jgi:D-alanyl-D-alanine carboxypeptidase
MRFGELWKGTSARIFLILIATVLCAPGCERSDEHRASTAERTSENPESQRLQLIVEQLRVDHDLPGLSVAIAEDGRDMLVATSGLADLEHQIPVTPDTKFFIGSVSKNLFGTIALRLVDEGRLNLESPLSTYVEWPRGDEVTIKMLLNHTSGIPEYMTRDLFEPSEDGGIPVFFRTPWTPGDLIAAIPDRALIFDPGSSQEYSNTNGLLVGEVLQEVTGQPLVTVFDQLLVHPLGLKHMYLYGESTADRDRARGYSAAEYWGAQDGNLVDCSSADEALLDSGDGSVVASAGDLLRYHQALRQGKLLGDSLWAAMCTVEPGIHNGLAYLIAQGPFGRVQGNLGKAMGHIAANVYYVDRGTYVVMMSNRTDVPLPLQQLLKQWFGPVE